MLKLKLQYFGYLMQRADSLEKKLMLGKTEGRSRRGWVRLGTRMRQHHQCNEHELGQTLGDEEGQGGLACCSPWSHSVVSDYLRPHGIAHGILQDRILEWVAVPFSKGSSNPGPPHCMQILYQLIHQGSPYPT